MKNKMFVAIIAAVFMGLSLWNLLDVKENYSESERRVLAKFPTFTEDFSEGFEEYLVDHFPARDFWRSIKVYTKTKGLMQKDNNGLYEAEGHLSKIEYPMNTQMLDHAINVFDKVNDKYLEDNKGNIYLAIIPDKNRYLAKENGYLSIEYEELSSYMEKGMNFAHYIGIADLLGKEDYYYTDSHWRQEKITDVSSQLLESMGNDVSKKEYEYNVLEEPFYGVYVGQSALKCKPDTIKYLMNDTIKGLQVEGANAVYDMTKAMKRDPYEMFLSGNQPIVTIKNSLLNNGKRLIVFRDSFGSSIAPLLAEEYEETILIDLRYVSSDMVGQFVEFEDADILFLYSTMLLNQSLSIK